MLAALTLCLCFTACKKEKAGDLPDNPVMTIWENEGEHGIMTLSFLTDGEVNLRIDATRVGPLVRQASGNYTFNAEDKAFSFHFHTVSGNGLPFDGSGLYSKNALMVNLGLYPDEPIAFKFIRYSR